MPDRRRRTPRQGRPSRGLVPNRPLPALLFEQLVIQHTPPGDPDPRRAAFDIPRDEHLFLLHLGPPRSWTPYMFDVVGTFPMYEATRERFRFGLQEISETYNLPYIVVWYRRVYLEEPGVSVAIRWYPHREEQMELTLPSRLPHKHGTRYLTAGLQLLRDLEGRGRPTGPAGFSDVHEFEDTLSHLIRTSYANGQGTGQKRIAELLRPILDRRRADTGAGTVDVTTESTVRLIQHHLPCLWQEFVEQALQSP